ncbi:MAG: hypothetical protein GX683_03130 [Ruminococcaceae bacterium]|jgi:hypothetical protein|nr:hypothetical protein [Oscillospiraceae bacterium]
MGLTEKVAFLKGLIEGSDLQLDEKNKKILDAMVEILDDLAGTVSDMDDDLSSLYEDVDNICDELDDIEEDLDTLFDEDEDEECDCDDEFMYDVTCEGCGETICVDEDTILGGEVICPSCGEKIEIDVDCECEDCADGCDCCEHDKK